MGEVKHTPGPWQYVGVDEVETVASGSPVASVYGRDGACQANARLIAAAPDLLAACEAALSDIRYTAMESDSEAGEFSLIGKLEAAIRKAKGEVDNG